MEIGWRARTAMRYCIQKPVITLIMTFVLTGCEISKKDTRTDGEIYAQVNDEFTRYCASPATPIGSAAYSQCRESNWSAEHRRFAEIRLSPVRTSSTAPSDPVGDAAEAAGKATRFVLDTAFFFALGAATAPSRRSYYGSNWGEDTAGSGAEILMFCNPSRPGPVIGTQECACNSNNQYFTSVIVQGAACPINISYDVQRNTWRPR